MDCLRSIRKNRWKGTRKLKKITALVVVTSFVLIVSFADTSDDCRFPAIYNFGDSNSDTGSVSATFGRVTLPNGRTFFGKPSGRYSDGRLLIDFIAQKLELPFLSAYLDALQPYFRNGANFAAAGSTIQPFDVKLLEAGLNPLTLNIQLSQFEQLKDRTNELYSQAKTSKIKSNLPIPEDFSKALYTLDIGQNDLYFLLKTMKVDQVKPSIPPIINQFALAIEKLYQEGARKFWIHNTGPIGCLPLMVIAYPSKSGDADQNGCIKSYNEIAQEFNKQLKDRVSELRTQFEDALLLYVDIYSAKYTLISEANKFC
ncbi:GDSL esterase/lipase At5g14450-like isoform X2 [Mangifera indica]|uniref:GDSL esterase/lipase At5g14450-like isoform X2 n=1 Tax=Mangifera indica TaxID=29780 RepID=UPI001CFA6A15|nr:GDSL esterase/lipase At5g14450-like isoform X2 [Mangifera indica]